MKAMPTKAEIILVIVVVVVMFVMVVVVVVVVVVEAKRLSRRMRWCISQVVHL